ncbi:MAG: phosphotransferase [Planctomycetia bacterium]|nr:phosphotransferase [Planctomycetia bacterium]
MLELTTDNLAGYLRGQGWIGPGPVQVELLAGGVSNLVFRVRTPERLFVLKQSCPQLRTQDAWYSDLDRVFREQEVMEVLHPVLPETVPQVLFSDRKNYVFAMSHAPEDAQVWKQQLLSGAIDLAVGRRAGVVLGRMHEITACQPQLVEKFSDRNVFIQLRVDPFYRRIQVRLPDLATVVEPLIQHMLHTRQALCHGDFSPKNILTHAAGFTLVDYETAHLGDPTMDLGFFLSHLILKAIKLASLRERCFALTKAFWEGYESEVQFRRLAELQARGIEHFAVCLLARVDGTSPVDYLTEERHKEAVRRIGRRIILRDRPRTWDAVPSIVADEAQQGDLA